MTLQHQIQTVGSSSHYATPYWLDALAELLRDVDEHAMWQWLDETYPDAMTADQVLADCREGINLGQRLAAREPGRPARGGIVSPWRPRLVGEHPETGGAPDA